MLSIKRDLSGTERLDFGVLMRQIIIEERLFVVPWPTSARLCFEMFF